jgi:PAS domain S-box-containing protein
MMMSTGIKEPIKIEKEIQILHLEDDEKDAELIQTILDSAGISTHITCIQSASEFSEALSEGRYELILADFSLPAYDGLSALHFSRENYPDIPFIFVSGTMGEDAAIDGLTQGATDYVLKNKLTRLVPAVQRALNEAENRKKRKDAEEALRETNVLLERIFSTTEFMLAYLDVDFNFIRVNRAYAETSEGKSPEFFDGKNHFGLYPDPENEAIFRRVVDTGEPYVAYAKPFDYVEHFERDKSYWNWSLQPVKDENGGVNGLVLSLVDVTEREQAYITLRQREEQLRLQSAALEAAANGIIITDRDGKIIWANSAFTHLTGYSIDEVVGRKPSFLKSGKHDSGFYEELWNTIIAGKIWHGELVNRRKDGHYYTEEMTIAHLRAEDGEISHFIAVKQDITKRKQMEDELAEREREFRTLAENSPDNIARYDADCRTLYVNPALEKALGRPVSEMLGTTSVEADLIDEAEKYQEKIAEVLETGKNAEMDIVLLGKGEGVRYHNVRFVAERGADGAITGVQTIGRDVTERKQHEREREAIITVSNALRQATTRPQIFSVILDQLVDLFDADGAVLMLSDPQTEGFINGMGRGEVGRKIIGVNIPPGKGVCNWVITNKKPYLNNRIDQDPLFHRPDLLGDSHCLAAAPLIAQEQAIGALWIARQVDFVEQDLRLLIAIADIAANAIHRVTLYEQTEQQLHRLIALHQIDLAISTNFDLNITLNVILSNVKDELEVDAVSILLLNTVTYELDYAAGIGFRKNNIERSHVRIGSGCAGRAAQECRTVSCLDIGQNNITFVRSSLLAGEDFVSHYATPLVVKGQVKGVLEFFHRKTMKPEHTWFSYFETLATQAAIAIENASLFENMQRSNTELTLAYNATIEGWSRALDLRDKETEGHTQRVTEMTLLLADKMGMSAAEKLDLRRGALLHDIGKMGVPDEILHKPGPLSDDEWEVMRKHPLYAYRMLSPIAYLKRALEIPYCHHEKWDGSGYPRGLKGEEIPLAGRLFAVVDVWDALTSDRPYRSAWSKKDAVEYIREQAGKHFDPQVVELFLQEVKAET